MLLLAPRDAAGSTARGDVPAQDDQQEPSAGPLLLDVGTATFWRGGLLGAASMRKYAAAARQAVALRQQH